MNIDSKKSNQFDFEFPLRNSSMPMMMSLTENVCLKERGEGYSKHRKRKLT